LENGASKHRTNEHRDLVVDRQQETLFLDFDSAGDYEVEFKYLPTGFVIGSIVSLISLVSLNLWWLAAVVSETFGLKRS